MSTFNFKKLALTSALASLFLAGCGGGGGGTAVSSTMLSGTVAGGAPVIGNVLITDSKGVSRGGPIDGKIDANGHYSIDVSGMTGPFVLKAAGQVGTTSVTYYSAATVADIGGTVNVTPFTSLIVSNIAATMAETYFSNPDNIASIGTLITPAKLAAAQSALHDKLLPALLAMNISDTIDLLRTSFAADHSGMDAALDQIKVETDLTTNIATLKYASTIIGTDDVQTPDDVTKVTTTSGMTTAVTDLQAVVTKLNNFAALFATSLPSLTTLQNSGVFDISSNFMMGGQSFDQFATELSTQQSAIGLKFSNVAISLDASGTSGTLTAVITSNTSSFKEQIQLQMVKVNGVWLVQGDGMIANVSLIARAERNDWVNYSASYPNGNSGSWMQSGINIWIDPFAYNSSHASAQVAKALITGPGLPTSGVTMVQDIQNRQLKLEGTPYSANVATECGVAVNGQPAPTTQCVNISQALDNSEYTVVLKDGNGASLNGSGYKLTLPKQPYATSALTATMFPSITAVTIDNVAITPSTVQSAVQAGGKSVNVSWTMPTGLLPKYLSLWANTATASYFRVEKDLLPTATSALIGLDATSTTGTVTNAGVWLEGVDTYGRSLALSKSVSIQ